MTPTVKLRFVWREGVGEIPLRVLQQWFQAGYNGFSIENPSGEWRDVPLEPAEAPNKIVIAEQNPIVTPLSAPPDEADGIEGEVRVRIRTDKYWIRDTQWENIIASGGWIQPHTWVDLTEEELQDVRSRVQNFTSVDNPRYGFYLQVATMEKLQEKNK